MARYVRFLDDGGVINDNRLRAPQWRRLVAEFFPPLLGGSPEAWAEANFAVMQRFNDHAAWDARMAAAPDYADFERAYFLDWLGPMCDLVGVPRPADDQMVALSREATAWIIPQVHAAFPRAAEAIRSLHKAGYVLHTASGEPSTDLATYLTGMGVLHCFGRLYGPDLVNTFKAGPQFYQRIMEDARVPPSRALIVDDSPIALAWAQQAGARTALITNHRPLSGPGALATVTSLAEFATIIDTLP